MQVELKHKELNQLWDMGNVKIDVKAKIPAKPKARSRREVKLKGKEYTQIQDT